MSDVPYLSPYTTVEDSSTVSPNQQLTKLQYAMYICVSIIALGCIIYLAVEWKDSNTTARISLFIPTAIFLVLEALRRYYSKDFPKTLLYE